MQYSSVQERVVGIAVHWKHIIIAKVEYAFTLFAGHRRRVVYTLTSVVTLDTLDDLFLMIIFVFVGAAFLPCQSKIFTKLHQHTIRKYKTE